MSAPPKNNATFVLAKREAGQVSLCGDFNNWAADVAPGRYQYKFLVDGEWIPAPLAKENVWNLHGTLNSVIEVRR